jgi:hypothetical protein
MIPSIGDFESFRSKSLYRHSALYQNSLSLGRPESIWIPLYIITTAYGIVTPHEVDWVSGTPSRWIKVSSLILGRVY